MDSDAMIELSATAATAAMRAGHFTALAYAEALLARCAEAAALNAFITLDAGAVRAAARAADARRAAGESLGLLHGLPIPIKDSVNTRDLPTSAGTRALADFRPARDATAVARLRAAGAIMLGKTNLHELSFGWTSSNRAFGPVRNPYDPTRIPGGSSGGTAAAVAARMAPLGVAEDTQGSIRVPAALCGLTAFRPTTGRYPTDACAPITPLFDQIGPHARCVEDLVLFDAVMTGDTGPISAAPLAGVRIGIDRGFFFADLDPEVAALTEAAIARLRAAGATIVERAVPGIGLAIDRVTAPIQLHDVVPSLGAWLADSGAPIDFDGMFASVSADVRAVFERFCLPGAPQRFSDAAYAEARDIHRPALQAMIAAWFADTGVAAMLFPATMVPATPIGADNMVTIVGRDIPFQTAIARNISPGSTAGLPGIVLPVGLTMAGLPVCLELDGPAGSDRALLALGLAAEAVLDGVPAPTAWRTPA